MGHQQRSWAGRQQRKARHTRPSTRHPATMVTRLRSTHRCRRNQRHHEPGQPQQPRQPRQPPWGYATSSPNTSAGPAADDAAMVGAHASKNDWHRREARRASAGQRSRWATSSAATPAASRGRRGTRGVRLSGAAPFSAGGLELLGAPPTASGEAPVLSPAEDAARASVGFLCG